MAEISILLRSVDLQSATFFDSWALVVGYLFNQSLKLALNRFSLVENLWKSF